MDLFPKSLLGLACLACTSINRLAAAGDALGDKTLVAWAAPANLGQAGGSVLTLDDTHSHFDAIVFGELARKKWMPGSDGYQRSQKDQSAWPDETAGPQSAVPIAIVYHGREVTVYRDGRLYAQYTLTSAPQEFGPQSLVMIGPRHLDQQDDWHFGGAIEDARIYDVALSAEQIGRLKPGEPSDPKPWAWWSFAKEAKDLTGRFAFTRLEGGARIENGRLMLDGRTAGLLAARKAAHLETIPQTVAAADIETARELRKKFLAAPYRPQYHFVIPEDLGGPFDPNGAIYWRGVYHLFYIYQEHGVHVFGHISSLDLLHWRQHPPALFPTPDSPEQGIFSGNCFVNKQGQATMLYHGVGAGNCIATAEDDDLEHWQKLPGNPIIPLAPPGAPYASWDPDGWIEGDTYYAIFGGTRAAVFKAADLNKWEYVGDFLHHTVPGVELREDISCADFFRLGNKRVLVCISHRLGARYYVGEWTNEQFHPEQHGRMSWVDNAFFAPESLADATGRRIMWAWLFDGRRPAVRRIGGWSGELSLPRELFLGADGSLRMRPAVELQSLRYREQTAKHLVVEPGKEMALDTIAGNALEIEVELLPQGATQCGLKVCRSPGGEEQTAVFYDATDGSLKLDVRKASLGEGPRNVETGPFALPAGTSLTLRVFVDKSVVEAFADDRQAVMRRIYPTRPDSIGVSLFAEGGRMQVRQIKAWHMFPANPY